MARKILLLVIAVLVPGGLTALVVAAIANWLRKRYQARKATPDPSDAYAPIEAKDRPQQVPSEPMFGAPMALA